MEKEINYKNNFKNLNNLTTTTTEGSIKITYDYKLIENSEMKIKYEISEKDNKELQCFLSIIYDNDSSELRFQFEDFNSGDFYEGRCGFDNEKLSICKIYKSKVLIHFIGIIASKNKGLEIRKSENSVILFLTRYEGDILMEEYDFYLDIVKEKSDFMTLSMVIHKFKKSEEKNKKIEKTLEENSKRIDKIEKAESKTIKTLNNLSGQISNLEKILNEFMKDTKYNRDKVDIQLNLLRTDLDSLMTKNEINDTFKTITDVISSSKIIVSNNEIKFLNKSILGPIGKQLAKCVFSSDVHGSAASTFHKQVDNVSPIIVLIETSTGKKFGGVTFSAFEGSNDGWKYIEDPNAFIFSFDLKKILKVEEKEKAIYDNISYGPVFGYGDICINDKCTTINTNTSALKSSYGSFDTSISKFSFNDNKQHFKVKRFEVFTLS